MYREACPTGGIDAKVFQGYPPKPHAYTWNLPQADSV